MQIYANYFTFNIKRMNTPADVAKKEVFARVTTLDQAKESYRKWVQDALALYGRGLSDEDIKFWNEVLIEIDKIDTKE